MTAPSGTKPRVYRPAQAPLSARSSLGTTGGPGLGFEKSESPISDLALLSPSGPTSLISWLHVSAAEHPCVHLHLQFTWPSGFHAVRGCVHFLGLLYRLPVCLHNRNLIYSLIEWRPELRNQGRESQHPLKGSRVVLPASSPCWWPHMVLGLWPHGPGPACVISQASSLCLLCLQDSSHCQGPH